jgi:hypothetical protein
MCQEFQQLLHDHSRIWFTEGMLQETAGQQQRNMSRQLLESGAWDAAVRAISSVGLHMTDSR